MLSLDDLQSRWLEPVREEDFSLPAIVNFRGMVQAAWDVAGIQNFICAPTGMATPAALLFRREGERIVRAAPRARFRWKAYEIEREGRGVATATRMAEDRFAVVQKMRFDEPGRYALLFSGLPRVWRFTDYWNLPPEDVPQKNVRRIDGGFLLDDTKTFGLAEFRVPGRLCVYDDVWSWLEGRDPVERGRAGVAEIEAKAGDTLTWWAVQGCEETLPPLDPEAAWTSGRTHWERVWDSAFTPGNPDFSGHLPAFEGPLERLYLMGVLTLLMTRRILPQPSERALIATGGQCVWNAEDVRPLERAYVCGGPEGGMTTSFLWELTFQAPLLARLDPTVLRAQMDAFLRVDLHRHWGVETVSGAGAGMAYGVNPGGFLSCMESYVRIAGDRQFALDRIDALLGCCRPGLTDYGRYENVLECVSTYEHQVASFNALDVQGMRFVGRLTGDGELLASADALARDVLALYAGGPFACAQPDGSRRVVRTILDFLYVGRSMTEDLPQDVCAGMVAFFENELKTDDWCYALSPQDDDALTQHLPSFQRFRADHQATGSYDGWPAHAASVLLRFGLREKALRWLEAIQELTHEGPFGQAHLITPQGAVKAGFMNGNMYFAAAGCAFATTLLEDLR